VMSGVDGIACFDFVSLDFLKTALQKKNDRKIMN